MRMWFVRRRNCAKFHVTLDDEAEVVALMRAARAKARGYADFFGWGIDRDLEEFGVISSLSESLKADGILFFSDLKQRGRPNDPPDCEALDKNGLRIALEVTELVDEDAICAFKQGRVYDWAEWSSDRFISTLAQLVMRKDGRFPDLKGPPYDGGYVVVVHTDEPMLSRSIVEEFLTGCRFNKPSYVNRAFIILSYDPAVKRYPYFELDFH